MDYKQAFLSQLENSYLGVQIQDAKDLFSQDSDSQYSGSKEALKKSGFINLLQMKSKYFQHIKTLLEKEKLNHSIYTKLYNFFSSYLNETGTPFFYDTPMHKNIYAKVYTNSKDTSLFYKTQNLYYVKSDTLYHDAEITSQDSKYTFIFDTSHFIPNADNAKNKAIFKFTIEENIRIYVLNDKENLKELPNVFKQNSSDLSDEFIKSLKDKKIQLQEEEIKKILSSYKRQNEIDFFIHKNARAFLQEQFNLWLCNYVLDDITQWRQEKIEELNTLKKVAFTIIDYIADFEDELKAIWCKPKFAKKVEYVFSLDRIDSALLDSIINDEGFKAQIKEWQELRLIDESFDIKNINDEKYKFLPLDTKHFSKTTKYKILSSFKDIESTLNGELIKSDNFQALNTLLPKYQNKVDLIYIDPPFNTGSDFEYKDKFQDSTWLTLMENRLELAKEFLSDRGSFYLHLDENADYRGKELFNEFFDDMEHKKITFDTNATKDDEADLFGYKSFGNNFVLKSSTILFCKKENSIFNKLWKPNRNTSLLNLGQLDLIGIPKIESPKKIIDYEYKIEKWSNGKLDYKDIDIKDEKIYPLGDIWNDLYSFTQSEMRVSENVSFYSSQKPENMLRRIIQSSSNQDDIVMDFFAGSGTTLAVAHKFNRKYLGVEMGEHFYEKYRVFNKDTKQYEHRLGLLGRIKNVLAGDIEFCAVDKQRRSSLSKMINFKGGGAFRYYELESYEESLSNCEYVLDKDSIIDYRKSRKLIKGLKKGETISLDMSGYRENFDILHTMANVLGLRIQRLFLDSKGIECVEFDNGDIVSSDSVDLCKYPKLTNLIWWEK